MVLVAPEKSSTIFCHWYANGALPDAMTVIFGGNPVGVGVAAGPISWSYRVA